MPDNSEQRAELTCPWWVAGVLTVCFVVLAILAEGPNTLQIDIEVSAWVQGFDSPFAEWLAEFGDIVGGSIFAIAMLIVGLAVMGWLKRRRELWFIAIAAVGRLAAMLLKGMLDSPRPTSEQVETSRLYDGYGFPSGHTTTAAIVVGTLAFLIARQVPSRGVRVLLGVVWALGIAVTAYARIWHGAHWFTDTVGGATVGIVVVIVAANISAVMAPATVQSSATQTPPPQTTAQ